MEPIKIDFNAIRDVVLTEPGVISIDQIAIYKDRASVIYDTPNGSKMVTIDLITMEPVDYNGKEK